MPDDGPVTVEFPKLEDLSIDARALVLTLGNLCLEIKLFREAWMAAPMQEINVIMLENMKRQMSGIAPVIAMPGTPSRGSGH